MNSRILFINFTRKELEKFRDLPAETDRGYMSDIDPSLISKGSDNLGKKSHAGVKFHFPYSIHEYKVIFINLNNNPELDTEFGDMAEPFLWQGADDFINYWLIQGRKLIAFLGDYSLGFTTLLGVRGIKVLGVNNRDKTIN